MTRPRTSARSDESDEVVLAPANGPGAAGVSGKGACRGAPRRVEGQERTDTAVVDERFQCRSHLTL